MKDKIQVNAVLSKIREFMVEESTKRKGTQWGGMASAKIVILLDKDLEAEFQFGNITYASNPPSRKPFVGSMEIRGKALIPWLIKVWGNDEDPNLEEYSPYTDWEEDGTIDQMMESLKAWLDRSGRDENEPLIGFMVLRPDK